MVGSIALGRLVLDPARIQELINPEFIADGAFLHLVNGRAEICGEYGPLPAAAASEPTVLGCFFGEGEQAVTAVVALMVRDGVVGFHVLKSPVDGRTPTVADAAEESILGGGGPSA